MEELNYNIEKYFDKDAHVWDQFLQQNTVNGTFLQSRNFLEYHPKGRFVDYSYIVYDKKGHIAAVCPACLIVNGNQRMLISHQGSTFGGIIFGKKYYCEHKIIEIIRCLEQFWKCEKINCVELRVTPELFSQENCAALEYGLYYCGYQDYVEVSTYIDYKYYENDILRNFEQGKRTNVHNCLKAGLVLRELNTDEQIAEFYQILCENLQKFDSMPVHTITELLDFNNSRLTKECGFYGIYDEEKMLAGAMMFYFANVKVAHTQYLCALQSYYTLSPMTFLYYAMIREMREKGYEKISFGISTEQHGKKLNFGLTKSKESFGGKHTLNRTYWKDLT